MGVISRALKGKGFRKLPVSFRLFISSFLCVAGFGYLALLGSIWTDTEMRPSLIMEGYGSMGNIELIHHSFNYMFWFFGIFVFEVFLFLLTKSDEKLKIFFSAAVPLLIVTDIGSAWFIRYEPLFAYGLFVSGFLLAASFFLMFVLIQYDLWGRKHPSRS